MTDTDTDVCPVCRRGVLVTWVNRFVYPHETPTKDRCPMSGHPLPIQVVAA